MVTFDAQDVREAMSDGARRHYATARAWVFMASRGAGAGVQGQGVVN